MPNSLSAKKRLRQDKVRRLRNRAAKSTMKSQIKRVISAVSAGDFETAEKEYITAARKLDQASAKNIIHKNTAARYKSRLQKRIATAKNA